MLVTDGSLLAKTPFEAVLHDIELRRTRSRALSSLLRLAIALAFAGLAAALAAYYAARGLFGHLIASGPSREAFALAATFLVGSAAWRLFTDRADRLPAG